MEDRDATSGAKDEECLYVFTESNHLWKMTGTNGGKISGFISSLCLQFHALNLWLVVCWCFSQRWILNVSQSFRGNRLPSPSWMMRKLVEFVVNGGHCMLREPYGIPML